MCLLLPNIFSRWIRETNPLESSINQPVCQGKQSHKARGAQDNTRVYHVHSEELQSAGFTALLSQ